MNKQLETWQGGFGDDYVDRNPVTPLSTQRKARDWQRILSCIAPLPASILEVGANVGQNIAALRQLTSAELFALEPNERARTQLVESGLLDAEHVFAGAGDRLPFQDRSIDLAFTSGVLIHVAPENLLATCREIHRVARRHVLAIEYFSDEPMEKRYRGSDGLLFLRDYGAFWLDNFADLSVVDFGFFWKRFSGDSLNWWLLRKAGSPFPEQR